MSWFGKDSEEKAEAEQTGQARPAGRHAAGTGPAASVAGHSDPGSTRVDDEPDTRRGRTSEAEVVLSEERLGTGTETVEAGSVRARKHVDVEQVQQTVPRGVEHADLERTAAAEGDSGQVETLPDGSISIPVFEEQIVIEKRLVVRERVVLRKHTVYEEHQVQAELRRERLEVETEGDARVTEAGPRSGGTDGVPEATPGPR